MRRALLSVLCVCSVGLALAVSASAADKEAKGQDETPFAYVTVAGAPGDGGQSLTKALNDQLLAAGVKQAPADATKVFEIEGIVRIEDAKGGKQSIQITWIVFDPEGNTLGHVSQTKIIRKGTLDKKWGPAANAAASAAVDGIVKLLPR
jgi:hypothetical protein